ncbi:MAG TPA: (Fe-S)-binding protein [Saprospiraceae bacterium]|nr:(Fe-S)-binding protein [Saprospiraceae bacterium]
MKISLFIPCYIDQFYPQVGIATYELLTKLGYEVIAPLSATCCGQPMANSGFEQEAKKVYHHFVDDFGQADVVVMPSGSCTMHVREHYDVIEQTKAVKNVRKNTFDLVEFLFQHGLKKLPKVRFNAKVALHTGCHSLRGLGEGKASELYGPPESALRKILQGVKGLEFVELDRPDECCGFGGTFSVTEEAVSVKMGQDKLADVQRAGADILVSNDMSCLMHLEGILRKQGDKMKVMHIAEILNS